MKELVKMMSSGNYSGLYEKLKSIDFHYELEEYTRIFETVASEKKYAFLTYVIAKSETPDLHLLLCDILSYTDTFFYDIYTVQKWHLKRALEISPNNKAVLEWITCTFNEHPSSPFNEDELSVYNRLLDSL